MKRAIAVLALLTVADAALGEEAAKPRAVVELFTSQGCSSCPPADHLMGELAKDRSLIALTLPVTYWDYLGWTDTLGSSAHSARQRAYAMARGDRKVFTPQVVVNGVAQAVGNNAEAVARALEDASRRAGTMTVNISVEEEDDRIKVLADSPPEGAENGEVWMLATLSARSVAIGRGENSGHTVPYVNIVRKMTRLGPWIGKVCAYSIAKSEALAPDADGYVVLVQTGSGGKPGAIIGATQVRR